MCRVKQVNGFLLLFLRTAGGRRSSNRGDFQKPTIGMSVCHTFFTVSLSHFLNIKDLTEIGARNFLNIGNRGFWSRIWRLFFKIRSRWRSTADSADFQGLWRSQERKGFGAWKFLFIDNRGRWSRIWHQLFKIRSRWRLKRPIRPIFGVHGDLKNKKKLRLGSFCL